jgi:hypothetical protein
MSVARIVTVHGRKAPLKNQSFFSSCGNVTALYVFPFFLLKYRGKAATTEKGAHSLSSAVYKIGLAVIP